MGNLAIRDDRGCQTINGVLYAMASPTYAHQLVASNLAFLFTSFLKGKTCQSLGGLDVHLDDRNTYIPDLFILCDRGKMRGDGVHGAPDLVVEILSPSTEKMDRTEKKDKYAESGVKEYWLVNPKAKAIEVYCLENGALALSKVCHHFTESEMEYMPENDKKAVVSCFSTSIFEDLVINVKDVFDGVE